MAEHENAVGASDDWYTPPSIFAALRLTFDLDPCSPGPGHWVPAKKIYTAIDDGLVQPWHGLVFMNPPFGGRFGHVVWLRKFLEHKNGVAIVRSYTSSSWWHEEMPKAELILFPRGKTKFVRPDGSIGTAPGHGIVLVGMGDVACEALLRSGLGMVWDRRDLRRVALQRRFDVGPDGDRHGEAPHIYKIALDGEPAELVAVCLKDQVGV